MSIQRKCIHGAADGACSDNLCHHCRCEHGKVYHRCGPCRYRRELLLESRQWDLEATETKKDRHRARFAAEPVVCVWGEP